MGRASCRRGYPKADWAVFLAARPAHIRDFEARWRRRWAAIVVGKCGASRQPVRAGGGDGGPGWAGDAGGDGGGEAGGVPVPALSSSPPPQVRRHGRRLPVPRRLRPGAQPAGAAARLHV